VAVGGCTAAANERGIRSVAPDLPSMQESPGDLYDDVTAVRSVVAEAGPVILCGHAYGGLVITEAADSELDVCRCLVGAPGLGRAGTPNLRTIRSPLAQLVVPVGGAAAVLADRGGTWLRLRSGSWREREECH
jgi:pimeloyl-ACP methyl ester carboxylesterase